VGGDAGEPCAVHVRILIHTTRLLVCGYNTSRVFGGMMEEISVTEVELVESVDEETLPEFALMIDIPD
jgi:hypothetical protein